MNFIDDGYYISLPSQEVFTKDDIVIDYQPEESVIKFSYTIIKDGKRSETVEISDNSVIRIVLKESGQYKIEFTNYYNSKDAKTFLVGMYNIDKTAPLIEFTEDEINIRIGENVDFADYVIARDNADGDITHLVKINDENVDLNAVGEQKVYYQVTDSAGNTTSKTLIVNVTEFTGIQSMLTKITLSGLVIVGLFIILSYYHSIKI